MYEEYFRRLREFLYLDYILSDEPERIINPVVDEEKLRLYENVVKRCAEYSESHNVKIEFDDPEFPKCIHLINMVFPTEEDDFEIKKEELGIFRLVSSADSVIIDTDKKGNVMMDVFFEDIYKES